MDRMNEALNTKMDSVLLSLNEMKQHIDSPSGHDVQRKMDPMEQPLVIKSMQQLEKTKDSEVDRGQKVVDDNLKNAETESALQSQLIISQIANRLESQLEEERREQIQFEHETMEIHAMIDHGQELMDHNRSEDERKFDIIQPQRGLYSLVRSEIEKLSLKLDDISMNLNQTIQRNALNNKSNSDSNNVSTGLVTLVESISAISKTVNQISDQITMNSKARTVKDVAMSLKVDNFGKDILVHLKKNQIRNVESTTNLDQKLDRILTKLNTLEEKGSLDRLSCAEPKVNESKVNDTGYTTNVCWQPSGEEEICGINRIANLEQHLAGSPTTEEVVSGIKKAADQSEQYFAEYLTTLKEEILKETKQLLKVSMTEHFEDTKTLFEEARLLHFSTIDAKFMNMATGYYEEITNWRHEIAANILKIERQINAKNREIGNISVLLGQQKTARMEFEEYAIPTTKILSDIKNTVDNVSGDVQSEVVLQMDGYRKLIENDFNRKLNEMQKVVMSRHTACRGMTEKEEESGDEKEERLKEEMVDGGGVIGGDAVDDIVGRLDASMKMYVGEITSSQTQLVHGLVDKVWEGIHKMTKEYMKGLGRDLIGRLESYQKAIDFRIQMVGEQVEKLDQKLECNHNVSDACRNVEAEV